MNSNSSSTDLGPHDGLSYVKGAQFPPLLDLTIPALLQAAAQRFPDRTAAVFHSHNVKWSWAELARKVDAFAFGLFKLGLKKGDRVGMWGPNSPEWLITQFATARLGLVLVNINPAYRLPELEYALNKVRCRAIVTAEQFKYSNYIAMLRELAPELALHASGTLRTGKLPHLEFVIKTGNNPEPGMLRFEDLNGVPDAKDIAALDAITKQLRPDDAINIQFTSGTTGSPKGATLTHRNIVNNGYFTVATMEFTPDDRLCIPVPLYHCFGMVMGALGCVSTGTVMVFPGEGFDPRVTLDAIAHERCTAVYGVPSMFAAMLDVANFSTYDLKSLRTGVMAGAPCPVELMKRVNSEMHMSEVTIGYGMTETSPVSFQSAINDPLERRVSTVGRVHPHVEVKIVDGDGNTVPVGVAGEMCTRGYSVMLGYWDDDTRTRESVKDGWMHTGDLGVIDEEGFGRIVGRLKDMVIRGGENIYPREVEELLIKNPKIREVQVFGVPDDHFGEELCAFVVCREGQTANEEEIRAFCRDKISHYKVPKYVRFRQELPMTATGKAQKYKMRDEMIAELGLKK
jgi:fatty-acyl-CoA synthase